MTGTADLTTAEPQVIDPNILVDAAGYARDGFPHDTWTTLRRESPVHWCEPDGVRPFWAVTRHADVRHVSIYPETWLHAPRLVVMREELENMAGGPWSAARFVGRL